VRVNHLHLVILGLHLIADMRRPLAEDAQGEQPPQGRFALRLAPWGRPVPEQARPCDAR
jgi:hypothetical protein